MHGPPPPPNPSHPIPCTNAVVGKDTSASPPPSGGPETETLALEVGLVVVLLRSMVSDCRLLAGGGRERLGEACRLPVDGGLHRG